MPVINKKIVTDKNTWTFDISVPEKGLVYKILRIHGDVTDRKALFEAIDRLTEQVMMVPSVRRRYPLPLLQKKARTAA